MTTSLKARMPSWFASAYETSTGPTIEAKGYPSRSATPPDRPKASGLFLRNLFQLRPQLAVRSQANARVSNTLPAAVISTPRFSMAPTFDVIDRELRAYD